MQSGFNIFNASAGSGKTYQLTKTYLSHILSNVNAQKFREILALTFTNKAVAEMKSRILQSLWVFGNPKISKENDSLFLELKKELDLTAAELEKKSALALKLLLHNYDSFEVSTIDKFTHRVIRTFAKDLKISQSFEVALDDALLLDEAIGKFILRASEEKELQQVLIDFSLHKIEHDKSWNIIYDLKKSAKLLFNENHYPHVSALKTKKIADFEALKIFLINSIKTLSETISQNADDILQLIQKSGLEFSDFKGQYFPKFMATLKSGSYKVDFNASWKQNFETLPLYKSTCDDHTKAKLDSLHPYFSKMFRTIETAVYDLQFFKNVHNQVLPLTVLNEIAKEISRIQKEKDILHISAFNKLISQEISNQPVPYIYERLGEQYRHYFIDEFQDTSTMQWHNLIPLISNALESENLNGEKGSLLLVGDAKQAIYRWRGGDPKQLLNLNDSDKNPFSVNPDIHHLTTNWRSHDIIVEFNNKFFTYASNYLNEPSFQKLYFEQCQQNTHQKAGGYVEIVFAPNDSDDMLLFYGEQALQTIYKILDHGFSYSDICILVRKNSQSIFLANYLSKHQIPIISSEALLLAQNLEVQFLVSLLRVLNNPSDDHFQFKVLEYLFKDDENKHDCIIDKLPNFSSFLKTNYAFTIKNERCFPLLDILERAINAFNLNEKCGAHVIHFLDEVFEISKKTGVGIHDFLAHWDIKKHTLAISTPPNANAVQLMTIHKSKGLEFPFVIFPFADSKLNEQVNPKELWIPVSKNLVPGFDTMLTTSSEALANYSEASKAVYKTEKHLSELDGLNVLYVAMTRAVKGLVILTKQSKSITYGTLFQEYLQKENRWNAQMSYFQFGKLNTLEPETALKPQKDVVAYVYSNASL